MADGQEPCQLVLTLTPGRAEESILQSLAVSGQFASCILYQGQAALQAFEAFCARWVPEFQSQDVAVLIADQTQVFGRTGADGIFLEKVEANLGYWVNRFTPKHIVGCGNLRTRHAALEAGETKPDFVFFGALGGNGRANPHPKDIELAEWWSEVTQIPCVVMAGDNVSSLVPCLETGAEFLGVEKILFNHPKGPSVAL